MKRKVYSIFLSFLVLFTSFFSALLPCFCSHATAVAPVAEIVGYFLSSIGAVDLLSGGSVRGVTQSIKDSLAEKVSDLMGTGIYEDSNGNYVFSGTATKELYDTLLGSDNIYSSVNIVSDFYGNSPTSDMYYTYDSLFSLQARSVMSNMITDSGYSSYYIVLTSFQKGSTLIYYCQLFDLSNVSYIIVNKTSPMTDFYSSQNLNFTLSYYDKAGVPVSVSSKYFYVNWNTYNNTVNISNVTNNSSKTSNSYSFFSSYNKNSYNNYYDTRFFNENFGERIPTYLSDGDSASIVNFFPFASSNNGHTGSIFWANKSIILATSTNFADRVVNQNSGIMVSNTFNSLPTVSKTVIENNNWNNIYNQYIENVSTEYGNGDGLSIDDLRNLMKRFSDNINNAVSSGVDDIQESITTTNAWLKKILQKLNQILEYLNNNGSGGSGSGGSSSDYSTILNNIFSSLGTLNTTSSGILSDCDTMILRLTAMNNKLQDILDELQSMEFNVTVSPAPDSHFNPTVNLPDIYNELNAPDFNIDSSWLKTQGMVTALKDVMPLCYLFLMVDFVSGVSSEPIAPRFEIPFRFNSTSIASAQFNENLVLDFTLEEFESFHSILENVICFIFCIWLIFISFRLIQVIMSFF